MREGVKGVKTGLKRRFDRVDCLGGGGKRALVVVARADAGCRKHPETQSSAGLEASVAATAPVDEAVGLRSNRSAATRPNRPEIVR